MSLLISSEYRALLAQKHTESALFGTSGSRWASAVHSMALKAEARTVLDYGCGKETLATALKDWAPTLPYEVIGYDPAIPGREGKPLRADLVICGDVLEHIEPECLDAVLDDIRNIARLGVLLVIATKPANKTLADGRNTHLIVEPAHWWLPRLLDRWEIRTFQNFGGEFLFVGAPR